MKKTITTDVEVVFPDGAAMLMLPGVHFTMILPDGTSLNVEQTQDDFSIVKDDGVVAYTKGTSKFAKRTDADVPTISGQN